MNSKVLELAKIYEDKNILIISHGGAINSLLYTLSDGEYGSGITSDIISENYFEVKMQKYISGI